MLLIVSKRVRAIDLSLCPDGNKLRVRYLLSSKWLINFIFNLSNLQLHTSAHCPVRPPQTVIGRTAGALPGSAPVPVAVFGLAPLPLKIAQPLMAGFTVRQRPQSRQGRKVFADGHHCARPPFFLPSLAGLFHLVDAIPSHEWLGYCHRVAPRLHRLRPFAPQKFKRPIVMVLALFGCLCAKLTIYWGFKPNL